MLIVSHGRSELMTAVGSYSQADEDRSLPTCCHRPQTIAFFLPTAYHDACS